MHIRRIFLFLILALVSLTGFAADKIRIAGSTTVLPIISEAAKQYRVLNPGLGVTVSGGGSGVGVSSVGQGKIEIGMASRSLTEKEKQRLKKKVREVAIARDAIAVAISKEVYEGGVTHLSVAQIADIYRGRITN
ncbi:substrate-binding domain-containing protein [Pseudomonadota bacterium]